MPDRKADSLGNVAVLIATYDGAKFLRQQLDSIHDQSVPSIDVWASDDGSTDATLEILNAYQKRWDKGRFEIVEGPQTGFSGNFRHLLQLADVDAHFVAFSDQDDLWRPDKLAIAGDWLAGQAAPALHCSRTELIDQSARHIGFSPLFARPPSFRNAIVQSIAGGNTMVFNRAGHQLMAETARRTAFLTHDWWSYIAMTAAGGAVHYSDSPTTLYRQHGDNLIGSNHTLAARVNRLDLLLRGRFARWTDSNIASLDVCRDLLTDEAKALIDEFRHLRARGPLGRVTELKRLRLYRQTALGQASLYAASLLNRL